MDRPSRMSASIPAISSVLAGVLLLGLGTFPGWAQQAAPPAAQDTPTARQDNPPAQTDDQRLMRGLDEQVQEIKSEVLSISQELTRLEEKLLFPSGTQVAVFVELAPGATLRLDAVRLSIDGQLVTHYIYSAKELEALRKGGVQRVYVGNVATGSHQIEVLVDGKLASGADFTHTDRFGFRKEVKPKLLGLTLAGPDSDTSAITLAEW